MKIRNYGAFSIGTALLVFYYIAYQFTVPEAVVPFVGLLMLVVGVVSAAVLLVLLLKGVGRPAALIVGILALPVLLARFADPSARAEPFDAIFWSAVMLLVQHVLVVSPLVLAVMCVVASFLLEEVTITRAVRGTSVPATPLSMSGAAR